MRLSVVVANGRPIAWPKLDKSPLARTNGLWAHGASTHAQWKESFSKHLWVAFVVVFLAEMGRIPCCGRPESSSSNI